jgi:hypothetical protein
MPDAGIVHGMLEVVGREGEPLQRATAQNARERAKAIAIGTTYPGLASFCSMYTSATLMRREALEQIGGFDETLATYEDWDVYLRLSLKWRLEYVECPAAKYRIWPGNVAWDRTANGVVDVAEKHLAMLPSMSEEIREHAQFDLLRRVASSQYTLVQLGEARSAAWAAFRFNPRRGISDADVRRVLTRSRLPRRFLEKRRKGRSG